MRLAEFDQPSAEQRRVTRQQDDARMAKDRAKQLDAQAKVSADRLKLRQSQHRLQQSRAPVSGNTIKPHA